MRRTAWLFSFVAFVLVGAGIWGTRIVARATLDAIGGAGWQRVTLRPVKGPDGVARADLSAADIEKLEEATAESGMELSVERLSGGRAEAGPRATDVTVVATDSRYPAFTGLRLLSGSFFTSAAEGERSLVAVLNARAARELYGGTDVIGLAFRLRGILFTVVGVAEEPTGVSRLVGEWGEAVVFVPARTADPLWPEARRGDPYLRIAREKGDPGVDALLRTLGMDPSAWVIRDWGSAGRVIAQRPGIVLLGGGLGGVAVAVRRLLRLGREAGRRFRARLRSEYILAALAATRRESLWWVGQVAFFAAAVVFLLAAVLFVPYVAPEAVPEVLTDFGFYVDRASRAVRELLAGSEAALPRQERLLGAAGRSTRLLVVTGLCGVALLLHVAWAPDPRGGALSRACGFAAALALGMGLCAGVGAVWEVQVRMAAAEISALWVVAFLCALPARERDEEDGVCGANAVS